MGLAEDEGVWVDDFGVALGGIAESVAASAFGCALTRYANASTSKGRRCTDLSFL